MWQISNPLGNGASQGNYFLPKKHHLIQFSKHIETSKFEFRERQEIFICLKYKMKLRVNFNKEVVIAKLITAKKPKKKFKIFSIISFILSRANNIARQLLIIKASALLCTGHAFSY